MLDILAITGPIYLCIALGFAAVRWRVFTPTDMRVLGKFVIQFALAALLFNALASRPIGELLQPAYLLAFGAGSVVWLLVGLWSARKLQRHGHEGFTAAALLATTVASFFSLSAILWLMRHSAGWLA